MKGSLENPPIVVKSSRVKTAAALLGCMSFVAIFLWLLEDGEHRVMAYIGLVFFSLGIPLAVWSLIKPRSLTLDPSGIRYFAGFSTTHLHWKDVCRFRVWNPAPSSHRTPSRLEVKSIGYDFSANAPQSRLHSLSGSLVGVQGTFGSGWSLSAVELVNLLNEAQRRWEVMELVHQIHNLGILAVGCRGFPRARK